MGCPARAILEYKIQVPVNHNEIEEMIEEGLIPENEVDFEIYTYKEREDPEFYIEVHNGQSISNCTEIEELEPLEVTKSMEKRAKEIQAFFKKYLKTNVEPRWYLQCLLEGY